MLLLHENCLYLCSCSYMDEGERRGGEGDENHAGQSPPPKMASPQRPSFPFSIEPDIRSSKGRQQHYSSFFPHGVIIVGSRSETFFAFLLSQECGVLLLVGRE